MKTTSCPLLRPGDAFGKLGYFGFSDVHTVNLVDFGAGSTSVIKANMAKLHSYLDTMAQTEE